MVKISVIVPVYNAEQYIQQCIESLLCQTLKECEFIFINDGSEDKSREVIEEYIKLDNRIKLINQENQGVSMARNTGIHFATGEYIGFVDADDYIDGNMYEVLYQAAKESDCDVVISNFKSEIHQQKVITKYPFPINIVLNDEFIEQEILTYFLREDNLNTVCNKVYKSKIIKENNIKFPQKVPLGEDGMFNMCFFSKAKIMKYIDYSGYNYRAVIGSATRNIAEKDYFKRSLEVYLTELPDNYIEQIKYSKIQQLKSIKLIKSVMDYVHVYFTPCKELSFFKRYQYISNMICNKYVREALPIYFNEVYRNLGAYEKFIINMIKIKSTMGLLCATTYSRLRNQ
ncbi:glycosyltransferase [Oceanirhabdus sp. W0125-5]|uniref:glycosyltransferase n=1 Tax=Oceanirhabdus sp. W0125-5 TaxID=2999116 RepID=UPI0022F2C46F|nr:glycosyltransferase [Oceanirhabdus sp. W0125-5]WBW98954.1 glycosyltransferase [Oceanirhabdus sp. W0125-5]